MAAEKLDYATLIADLENKINALQAALSSIRTAQAMGALGQVVEGASMSNGAFTPSADGAGVPVELPEGALLGKSVPGAVKLYLSSARKKQTIKQIAAALKEGGVESTSDNFENVVGTALARLKMAGEVLRFKDGWGLSEWYPAHLRGNPTAQAKSSKKPKKTVKKQAKKPVTAKKSTPVKKENVTAHTESSGSAEQQIIGLFRNNVGRELSKQEVAEKLGMRSQTATFILSKLAYRQRLEKTPAGGYKMAAVN